MKTMNKQLLNTVKRFNQLRARLNQVYVEREDVIDSLCEAAICKKHVILLGEPGTAKSAVVHDFSKFFTGADYFYVQLMQSTKPEEVFGNLSLKGLKEDRYERIIDGKLADTHFASIDEVFHCNSGLLQGMNEILNERTFQGLPTKLEFATATANFVKEENALRAFFDRWMYRLVVPDIRDDTNFKLMLLGKDFVIADDEKISLDELHALQDALEKVDVKAIINPLVRLRKELKAQGISLSARRWKWSISAIQARAILDGRDTADSDDIRALEHVLWEEQDQIGKISVAIGKVIDPMLQDLKSYVVQAQDIEARIMPLSTKIESEAMQINEGLAKLKKLTLQIDKTLNRKDISPKIRNLSEIMQKQINKIRLKIIDSKFQN